MLAAKPFAVDGTVTAKPDLPAQVPVGAPFTVDGQTGAGTRYRALAVRNPMDRGITIAAIPLSATDETLQRLLVVEALVIAAVLIVLGLVSWVVVRVGLLPLDRMGHTAGAIAGGDLSHRVESTDPRTEVGRLGVALNAMLDRLERAFGEREASEDRLRRFIADASHELRTPLASIRGYAELFRMGAAREPAEVEKAMRRIEDEAARMGVLVEDLLTLARLDEVPDTPHAELDLAALVRDAVDDGRAAAPGREIDLQIDGARRGRRRPRPAAPGARQPAAQRVRPHARGDADRGDAASAPATTCASRSATTAPACRPATPRRCSSASGARRPGASAVAAAPASGWRSWRPSSTRTAARCAPATPRAAAPASSSRCPPRAPEDRLPGGSQPPPIVVPRRAPTLWP